IASKPAPTRDRDHAKNEVASKPVKVPKKTGDLQVARFLYPKLSIQQRKCSPSALASAIHALVKSPTLGERKVF
ncbi:hypothetical protein, partial [Pseudomonas jessenii]|uniref:hypothetical protein n=1 Tax=Pseudomonas jessenii TaxID=77298 RepID=UPI0019D4CF8B